jgi:hypothetical protein
MLVKLTKAEKPQIGIKIPKRVSDDFKLLP